MKALRGRRQAAQLALLLLTWHASAQIQPASKAKQTYPATADLPHASNIPLLAFHGPVTTGAEAEVVDISLHVMLKTKRRKDGTFAVRTVSYGERFSLQGEFVPKHMLYCALLFDLTAAAAAAAARVLLAFCVVPVFFNSPNSSVC